MRKLGRHEQTAHIQPNKEAVRLAIICPAKSDPLVESYSMAGNVCAQSIYQLVLKIEEVNVSDRAAIPVRGRRQGAEISVMIGMIGVSLLRRCASCVVMFCASTPSQTEFCR